MRPMTTSCFLTAFLALAAFAPAQSMNVNFAGPFTPPPKADYAAAGLAGNWQNLLGQQAVVYSGLKQLDGSTTSVTVRNLGGTQLLAFDDPGTSGDDDNLMDEYLVTFNQIETCLFFTGLENGSYEVITYAWLTDQPNVDSRVRVDFANETPELVGGNWPGQHQRAVTYAVHTVQVTNGTLNMHSGIPPAQTGKAALNGLQLRKISTTTPSDADGDGDVDAVDALSFLNCYSGPGITVEGPVCNGAFDADQDADVDLRDFQIFQQAFTEGL